MRITEDPTLFECRELAQHARPDDKLEWEEALGRPLYWGLVNAIKGLPGSRNRMLLNREEFPLAAWGCHPTDTPKVGQVWFLATTEATRHVHRIHALWKSEMEAMHALFPLLVCYTHRDNHLHHTWLTRRGFELDREMALGPRGVTYFTYSRRA